MTIRKVLICAILLMIALCANLHARETERERARYFNFGPSGLLAASDGGVSPGFGMALSWNNPRLFGGHFGLGRYLNFLVPLVEDPGGVTHIGAAISIMVGPSMVVYKSGRFSVPVTVGYHFNIVSSTSIDDSIRWAINMGAGAAGDAVFQFGRRWNMFARIMAVYNFGAGGEFLLIPALGFGYRY